LLRRRAAGKNADRRRGHDNPMFLHEWLHLNGADRSLTVAAR
jgi:hypothetical protein